jgi:hypothetical protein
MTIMLKSKICLWLVVIGLVSLAGKMLAVPPGLPPTDPTPSTNSPPNTLSANSMFGQ